MQNARVRQMVTTLLLGAAACFVFELRIAGQPSTPGVADAPPTFKVDPSWPLEMPNKWILGAVTGVFVDAKQHVWVTHLPETLTEEETSVEQKPPIGTCCVAAPPVIEFDAQGKVVQGWGRGPMDDTAGWPRNPHGIFVDHNDFVWIGTYMHHRVMKFTRDGKLQMTIGQYDKNAGSNDTDAARRARPVSGSIRRPTRSTSPTATATAASSSSTARPATTRGTGAPTARSRTMRSGSTRRRW